MHLKFKTRSRKSEQSAFFIHKITPFTFLILQFRKPIYVIFGVFETSLQYCSGNPGKSVREIRKSYVTNIFGLSRQ